MEQVVIIICLIACSGAITYAVNHIVDKVKKNKKPKKCLQCGNCCRNEPDIELIGDENTNITRYCIDNDIDPAEVINYFEDTIIYDIHGECPFLKDNKCSIYHIQPIICSSFKPGCSTAKSWAGCKA